MDFVSLGQLTRIAHFLGLGGPPKEPPKQTVKVGVMGASQVRDGGREPAVAAAALAGQVPCHVAIMKWGYVGAADTPWLGRLGRPGLLAAAFEVGGGDLDPRTNECVAAALLVPVLGSRR